MMNITPESYKLLYNHYTDHINWSLTTDFKVSVHEEYWDGLFLVITIGFLSIIYAPWRLPYIFRRD